MPRAVVVVLLITAGVMITNPAGTALAQADGDCEAGTVWNVLHGRCLCPAGYEWSTVRNQCVIVSTGSGTSSQQPSGPTCSWRRTTMADLRNPTGVDPNIQFGDGWLYSGSPQGAIRRNRSTGLVETGQTAYGCDRGTRYPNGHIIWGDGDPVTVDDLLTQVGPAASEAVPFPEVVVNPPPPLGIVNLGMWLAVTNSEPVTLPVGDEVNGPWIRITATLTGTEWDMGNGDTVDCTGPGETVEEGDPGWNSPDEGPCGYTYTQHTPDDDTYTITATATWSVSWVASDRRSGTVDPIVLTNSVAYDVDEIQTVGASG